MGKQYEQPFEELLDHLGPAELRVFIGDDVHPAYRSHIEDVVTRMGAAVIASASQANLTVVGYEVREVDGAVGLAMVSATLGRLAVYPDGASVFSPA